MRTKEITMGQTVMSNILKVSYINGITDEWLADILGITTRTLQVRKKKPETLTLKEVDKFCKTTKTSREDIIK